jgi:hypothetical protein
MTIAVPTERVVAAAVRIVVEVDGEWRDLIFSTPAPARHHDVVHRMVLLGISQDSRCEQGFVTNAGRFANRTDATCIARAAGQITTPKKTEPQHALFSEDLW